MEPADTRRKILCLKNKSLFQTCCDSKNRPRFRHQHRQTDRQTDRQTHTHTHTHSAIFRMTSPTTSHTAMLLSVSGWFCSVAKPKFKHFCMSLGSDTETIQSSHRSTKPLCKETRDSVTRNFPPYFRSRSNVISACHAICRVFKEK